MNVAESIFKELSKFTSSIYGNPGTTEISFLKYLPRDFRYFLTLHDGLAIGMASGNSLLSGKIGVTNTHAAPGLMNSLGYVYSARLDRTPVLLLVGQQSTSHLLDEPILTVDLRNVPYVKDVIEIRRKEEVAKAMIRSVKTAISHPPGPVIVGLPYDIAEEEVGASNDITSETGRINLNSPCDPFDVEMVAEEINIAKQIAVVAGYEIDITDAHDEALELAKKVGSPVFAEPHFSRSPCSHIDIILPRSASGINRLLGQYDLILLLGGTLHNVLYMDQEFRWSKIIQVTMDPEEKSKRLWRTIICNPKDFLKLILLKVNEKRTSYQGKTTSQDRSVVEIMEYLTSKLDNYAIFEETPSYKEAVKRVVGTRKRLFFFEQIRLPGLGTSCIVRLYNCRRKGSYSNR
ncbi:thiamine pyrophosphate-binding protein [Metallosphaera hakonensis]|uniref:thiamine pyrophosphate-binding protein n=1 Tax=Metallosphaera hakonensis TaxID=79601 RepID=UPI000A904415|nr:thiamine pyrophosphate-binding protein [Metallosphaera hakonensis]